MHKKILIAALAMVAVLSIVAVNLSFQNSQNLKASLLGATSSKLVAIESDWEKCGKFNDVTPSDSFCWLTRIMRDRHIFTGDINGNFRPNDPVSRAEFAKILVTALYGLNVNLEDAATLQGSTLGFTDLFGTHWAYPYIKVAKERGLIKGYPDGTFKMDNLVSRAEFSKMVYSQIPDIYKKIQEAKTYVLNNWQNPDAYTALEFKANQWYTDYMMMLIYANSHGIFLQTCENVGKICPERPVTRLEIAAALQRLTTDYQLPVGYAESDTAVTGAITAENCGKIYKLVNITATLQNLGLNANDVINKCVTSYPKNNTTKTQTPSNPTGITSELSATNCQKIRNLSNITATLQMLGISQSIQNQCANAYPNIWNPVQQTPNPTGITNQLSAENCLKITRLPNMTATLQSLGIDTNLMTQCNTTYWSVWNKCSTLLDWKRAYGTSGLSSKMSSNYPPFTSEDSQSCANHYGAIWHSEISDQLTAENCLKITRLPNMTATLQSLGINTDLMTQCNTTYWSVWNKCSTLWTWKKDYGTSGLSSRMSSNYPPFTSEDSVKCAKNYGMMWHYEVNNEITLNNCTKIRRLSNMTAILQSIGIDPDSTLGNCADNFRSMWDSPNP